MFIDDVAVKSSSAPEERNVPALPRHFAPPELLRIGVGSAFYKHFVALGLKTTTENQNFLYCDDFETPHLIVFLFGRPIS